MNENNTCEWAIDELEGDTWGTSCGHWFTINNGTPKDNNMSYCCYCGKQIVEVKPNE